MIRGWMTNAARLLPTAIAVGVLGTSLMMSSALAQSCETNTVPVGANTTNPTAPFFINTQGLDLSTQPPTRNPNNPDYPPATTLADGTLPPLYANGNFVLGPTHNPAPETVTNAKVPQGKLYTFNMTSTDSVIYNPGLIRDDPPPSANCRSIDVAATAPNDPSYLFLTTSHPGTWTRTVTIYVPARHGFGNGNEMPLMVLGDGDILSFFVPIYTVFDNLIAERKIPPMIVVAIGSGGQDAQGAERGLEYDEVSGRYAEWVEREVLPKVEQTIGMRLTRDPDGRATMGISSSGAAAFSMAWFHPDLYNRVLAYSPTLVNQQWPHNTGLRGGAWEFHSPWAGPPGPNENIVGFGTPTPSTLPVATPLVLQNPRKPIRAWYEVGDRDLFFPLPNMPDGMHDWTMANEHMAKVLAAKGYQYQFVFSKNAGHVDGATVAQTLPHALQWVWEGYPNRRVDGGQHDW